MTGSTHIYELHSLTKRIDWSTISKAFKFKIKAVHLPTFARNEENEAPGTTCLIDFIQLKILIFVQINIRSSTVGSWLTKYNKIDNLKYRVLELHNNRKS